MILMFWEISCNIISVSDVKTVVTKQNGISLRKNNRYNALRKSLNSYSYKYFYRFNPKLAGFFNPKPMIVTVYMTVDQQSDKATCLSERFFNRLGNVWKPQLRAQCRTIGPNTVYRQVTCLKISLVSYESLSNQQKSQNNMTLAIQNKLCIMSRLPGRVNYLYQNLHRELFSIDGYRPGIQKSA